MAQVEYSSTEALHDFSDCQNPDVIEIDIKALRDSGKLSLQSYQNLWIGEVEREVPL
jgi:hypothetical protein